MRTPNLIIAAVVTGMIVCGGIGSCTKAPSKEESSKLEEARKAAEDAERKLSTLRQERISLEQQANPTTQDSTIQTSSEPK